MKGSKSRVGSTRSIPEYERLRLEKIKENAERMQAQGAGFLATKILERTQGFNLPSGKLNDTFEDNDDESTSEYDGSNENENTRNMEAENAICKKKKVTRQVSNSMTRSSVQKRSMAEFVRMNNPKQHHHVDQVGVSNIDSSIKKVQEKYGQKTPQPSELPNYENDQQVSSSQKRKQNKLFCSPGSMSAYLEYKKRNSENNKVIVESNVVLNDSDIIQMKDVGDDLTPEENDDEVEYVSDRDFELEMEALTANENEGSNSKKHRGPTKLVKVHARTTEERQVIVLNSLGQPIGPTPEVVVEFKFFLGTVARDSELAPLNYCSFPSLTTHDRIWDYVLTKYMVPIVGRKWVMDAISRCWRSYKCRFKKNHYSAYKTDELRWKWKPDTISAPQFRDLLKYWK